MGLMDRLFGKAAEAPKPSMTEAEKLKARDARIQQARLEKGVAESPFRRDPLPKPDESQYRGTPLRGQTDVLAGRVNHSTSEYETAQGQLLVGPKEGLREEARLARELREAPGLESDGSSANRVTELNRGNGLRNSRVGVVKGVDEQVEAVESWSARQAREAREADEQRAA